MFKDGFGIVGVLGGGRGLWCMKDGKDHTGNICLKENRGRTGMNACGG